MPTTSPSPLATARATRIADGKRLPATHGRIQDWAFDHNDEHQDILSRIAEPKGVYILTELEEEIASIMSRDVPDARDAIELARVREMGIAAVAVEAVRKWQALQVAAIDSPEVW